MSKRRLLGNRPVNKPEVIAAKAIKRQRERLSCGCVVYKGKDGKETDCPHAGAMVHEKCAECGHDFTAAAIEKATLTKAYNDVVRAHKAVLQENDQLTKELERVNADWAHDRDALVMETKELRDARHELSQWNEITLDRDLTEGINQLGRQRDHYAEIAKAKETEALQQHNTIDILIAALRTISEKDPEGAGCGAGCLCIGCIARDAIRVALFPAAISPNAGTALKVLRGWVKQRDRETYVRRLILKARDLSEGISKCPTPEEMAGVYDYIQKDAEEIAYIVTELQKQ